MDRHETGRSTAANDHETRERLASEMADVESAMAMVASGTATRMTLTGLRFGEEVARHFGAEAASRGLLLEPIVWPEDAGCDLVVRRVDE